MASEPAAASFGTYRASVAPRSPRALPDPPTTFIGRAAEIETVAAMLDSEGARLVTLTGTGGIGKTRLAIAAGHRAGSSCLDGVVFLPLHALSAAAQVWVAIAEAANVPVQEGTAVEDRVMGFLATRDLLLVLDNLEHLPGVASIVASLLQSSGNLRILCTSRNRLNLAGEWVYRVNPLPPAEALILFAQRAVAVDPQFRLDETTTPAVLAICDRLDGLPLAIELAAARVDVLPVSQLLGRVDHLSLLSGGPVDVPPRQQTMRETIDWSYRLLDDRDQRLLRRLSVFVGGFSLDAAATVANDGLDALDGVGRLVSAGLVWRIDGPAGDARFRLPSTIREFAMEELLDAGESDDTRTWHSHYSRDHAEEAIPWYDGPDLPAWTARIETDLDNCRAALAWALDRGDGETALRLSGALWRVWWPQHVIGNTVWQERVSEGLDWIMRALDFRSGQPIDILAEPLMGAGYLNRLLGRPEEGLTYSRELLRLSQDHDYPYGEYWALLQSAQAPTYATADGRPTASVAGTIPAPLEESRNLLERAVALSPRLRNPVNHAAMALQHLALVTWLSGNVTGARAYGADSLKQATICGNPYVIANAARLNGLMARDDGDLERAVRYLVLAVETYASWSNWGGIRFTLHDLAGIALDVHRPEIAREFLAGGRELPVNDDGQATFDALAADIAGHLNLPLESLFERDQPALVVPDMIDLGNVLADAIAASAPFDPGNPGGLTPRQRDVLRLLAEGLSNRAIADRLSISERTVDNHVLAILNRLAVDSRTAAATWAVRHGIM